MSLSKAIYELPDELRDVIRSFVHDFEVVFTSGDTKRYTNDQNITDFMGVVRIIVNTKFVIREGTKFSFVLENIEGGRVILIGDMTSMFSYCNKFNSDASRWDTSKVTNMKDMFYNCWNFNSDLSLWDTSNVTDMQEMFHGCTSFNSDVRSWYEYIILLLLRVLYDKAPARLASWDTSKVTNMKDMFYNCYNFNSDLSRWNVSNVTNMHTMFAYNTKFNSDLSKWDMRRVVDANAMFHQCLNMPDEYKCHMRPWTN
jgi:surface protein